MKSVNSKSDFVKRYAKGEFGNRSPTWETLDEFLSDTNRNRFSKIHIRNRLRGENTWYGVPIAEVEKTIKNIQSEYGIDYMSNLYFSAMCPHEKGTIQGEVMQTETGLNLFYGSAKKPMREAMPGFKTVKGLQALQLLKSAMNPVSIDWLYHLLDEYPYHVVEFTCLSINWGTIPKFNTLFWEVRNY